MTRAVLITGSNMGDRQANLAAALDMIGRRVGRIVAVSQVTESEPWGDIEDGAGKFLNQVIAVDTGLGPEQLLDCVQYIEKKLGRIRGVKQAISNGKPRYQSRTMDIDILFYGDRIIDTPRLKVPHPLMADRGFVLRPLAEVMPYFRHPASGLTVSELLERCVAGEGK